jgi:hypothetical protein
VPATLNLDNNTASTDDTLPGMRRCLEIANALHAQRPIPQAEALAEGQSYYSASLQLLARVAENSRSGGSTLDKLPPSIQLGPGIPPRPPSSFPPGTPPPTPRPLSP